MQQARDLRRQKDEEKRQKQEEKEANKLLKQQEKQRRQLQHEERQRTKQIAKEVRTGIEAQKRPLRKSKNALKQLNYDSNFELELEAIEPTTLPTEDESLQGVVEDLSLMEFTSATPARSRRDRKINLPQRYRE